MTYVEPAVRSTGDIITADDWNNLVTNIIALKDAIDNAPSGVPVGTIQTYAGATAPEGWLLAYGQEVSRTTYADLFAAIGETYGVGDGSTTFKLPDARGRVLVGKDNMGGVSANRVVAAAGDTLGGSGGAEKHTLTIDEIPSHTHNMYRTNDLLYTGGSNAQVFSPAVLGFQGATFATGGGGAHENMPPYITVNVIIKYAP